MFSLFSVCLSPPIFYIMMLYAYAVFLHNIWIHLLGARPVSGRGAARKDAPVKPGSVIQCRLMLLVNAPQRSSFGIGHHPRSQPFCITYHHRIGVLGSLIGHQGRMNATKYHRNATLAEVVGQLVGAGCAARDGANAYQVSTSEGSISSTPSSSRVTSVGRSGGTSAASVVSVRGA